jgi:hypothetical protein
MEGMWKGMMMAADEVFGLGRVLHCMAWVAKAISFGEGFAC